MIAGSFVTLAHVGRLSPQVFAIVAGTALALPGLARAESALVLDTSPALTLRSRADVLIANVSELPTGKFLVSGSFDFADDTPRRSFIRLDSTGRLDGSFVPPLDPTRIFRHVVTADGKIVIHGTFTSIGGAAYPGLARLLADGTLDTTFSPAAPDVLIQNFHTLLPTSDGGFFHVGMAFDSTMGATMTRARLKRNPATTQFEEIATNDNWGIPQGGTTAADITAAATSVFAFAFNDPLESALLLDVEPGEYTLVAGGVNNLTGLAIVELYDADTGTPGSRLINISNRGFAGVGDQVMIPGFVVSSEGPKTLLVRVVGPTLGSFGVGGTMNDPKLEVFPFAASTPILANDNWGDNPDAAHTAQIAAQVGAFALTAGSKDAAFVITLPPGSYTVVGSSAISGGTGVVIVEMYVVQ